LSADLEPAGAPMLGLDGEYRESDLPLLAQRRGMAYWAGDHVRILDRRKLPHAREELVCRGVEDVAAAIESMAIQGAFTLAIAAGYGMALVTGGDATAECVRLAGAASRLRATRKTGLALARMLAMIEDVAMRAQADGRDSREAILAAVEAQAAAWAQQALATARHALPLLPDDAGLLTHCFADRSLLYLLL